MKKRLLLIALAAALCLSSFAPALAADAKERGVLYYEEMIAPQYEDAGRFYEGLAAVKKDGKWGYIDLENNVVIPFLYDVANSFSEGYAVVGTFTSFSDWEEYTEDAVQLGFIDTAGQYTPFMVYDYWEDSMVEHVVPSYQYDVSYDYCFYGGWVFVHGLFDNQGKQFEAPDYCEPMRVPTEGLIPCYDAIEEEANCFYIDLTGKVVLDFRGQYTFYDAAGKVLPEGTDWGSDAWASYQYVSNVLPFNQGMALVWKATVDRESWEPTYRFGLIDKTGKWVIEPQFDYYYYSGYNRFQIFSDSGLASVGKDGRQGAIDVSGKTVVGFEYDMLRTFFEGRAVFEQNGLQGYLDTSGNVVIPARYQAAGGFSDGCAVVYDGTNAFLIDRQGQAVPGSDLIDPDNYFVQHNDGTYTTYSPSEHLVIREGGRYGYGKISYLPPLPEPSEMSSWAFEEVTAAIEADLVPAVLQNMYRTNILRKDFSRLAMQVLTELLDAEADELVLAKTGKTLDSWVREYPFSDSFDEDVLAAYALGIVTGYDDGTFRPYNKISRQEAAVMVTRTAAALGMDTTNPGDSGFADSQNVGTWAKAGVDFVRKVNVMSGTGDNNFSPQGDYTREQSFMCVYRLFQALLAE